MILAAYGECAFVLICSCANESVVPWHLGRGRAIVYTSDKRRGKKNSFFHEFNKISTTKRWLNAQYVLPKWRDLNLVPKEMLLLITQYTVAIKVLAMGLEAVPDRLLLLV